MDFPSSDLSHSKKRRRTVSRPSSTSDLGESQTSSGLNPFLIELVLANLFQFCDKKELDQYRLVCKLWHQASLPFWTRQLPTIHVTEDDEIANYLGPFGMRSFLGQVHSPSLSLYEFPGVSKAPKFSIAALTPAIDIGVLSSFWGNCGPWITQLGLSYFFCQDLAHLRDIVCSRFTPSLKKLSIDVVFPSDFNLKDNSSSRIPDGPRYKENPHFKSLSIIIDVEKERDDEDVDVANLMPEFPVEWNQLLTLYPNLENIAISNVWLTFQAEFKKILVAIREIREKTLEKLKCLKSIDVLHDEDALVLPGEQLDRSVVDLLGHPLLNFSSLGLRFDVVTDEQLGILRDILSSQASLKKLKFFMPRHFRPVRLGVVPQLEILHVYGFPFSSFSFLRNFPNLRSLKLYRDSQHGGDDEASIIVENSRGEEAVQQLQLMEFDCDFKFGIWGPEGPGPEAIHKMRNWMPNISVLKMELDDDMFPWLCEHFPNLEELVVFGDGLSDRAIAGCTTVGKPPNAALLCPFYSRNITAFHQLKSFEMDIRGKRIAKMFSVLSVIHGFAKLPQLRCLNITSDVEIRPSVILAFKEHLPFANILEDL